jgi:isoleucyl-tRNA synthetase
LRPSVYVKFKIIGKDEFILVWITTPWSLLGNTGVALNPEMDYVLVEHEGEKIWIGSPLVSKIESKLKASFKRLDEKKGSSLVGLKYEFLFRKQ